MNEKMINSLFIVKEDYEYGKIINSNNNKFLFNKSNKNIGKINIIQNNSVIKNKIEMQILKNQQIEDKNNNKASIFNKTNGVDKLIIMISFKKIL